MLKFLGQHIVDLIARFRSDVYLENVESGTIANGGNLGLDSNNKIVKAEAGPTYSDNQALGIGTGNDFTATHNGTDTYLGNNTGDLYITQQADDKDIIFRSDDGSGGTTPYITLDGSTERVNFNKPIKIVDSTAINVGSGLDLRLTHDGTDSLIQNFEGNLEIQQRADDKDIILQCDDGSGGVTPYITLDGSIVETKFNKDLRVIDNEKIIAGTSNDLEIFSSGADVIFKTWSGNMTFQQNHDDSDIIFQCDDGSGGTTTYLTIDGSNSRVQFDANIYVPDSVQLRLGSGNDLRLYHSTDSYISNEGAGDLYIRNIVDDKDINLQSDDGSGGVATYLRLDGSSARTRAFKDVNFDDSVKATFGASSDLQIFHDGTDSYLNNTTGDLKIRNLADDKDIVFESDNGSGGATAYLTLDGSTTHSYFSAGNVGIGITNPAYILDIHSGTTNVAARFKSGDNQAWISVQDDDSGTYGALFGTDSDAGHHIVLADRSANKRLVVDGSGNVGIGTDTPTAKLDVDGEISIGGGQAADEARITFRASDESKRFTIETDLDGSTSNDLLGFRNHGTDNILVLKGDGNVGIGTTSPSELLTIAAESPTLRFEDISSSNYTEMYVNNFDTYLNTNGRFFIQNQGSTKVTFKSDGNVGIGVTSPDVKFHVSGDTKFDNAYVLDSIKHSGDSDTQIKFTTDTIGFDTAGSERLTIKSDGDIGVGTTSPGEKLEVSGNIKASGTLVGKTRNVYNANFVADLGTTEYFVPLSTNVETTQAHQEEAAMLMPYDGRLVNVMFRTNSDIAHSDATLTVKLYKCAANVNAQGVGNFAAVGTAATHTIQAGDDHHVFNFACNADNTFSHTDLVAVSVQSNVDMHSSAKFVYCTVIFEYDLNTELTTTTEYDSTP